MEWRSEWYYQNYKINRKFACINWWSYWNSKTWNKKTREQISWSLLAHLAASVVQPIISLEIKGISGRGVRRAGRGYMDRVFSSAPSFKQYQDF